MIPLSTAIISGMTWSKIPHSRNYQLQCNGTVLGTISRPSLWSSNVVAESHEGRWTFRRTGFFGSGAEICDAVTGQLVATLKPTWGQCGTLTFSDGQAYRIACKGWWRPVWNVTAASGQPVLSLRTREKAVDLPAAGAVPDSRLQLLAMFTLYRLLQAEEDAASAAAVAVITAG